MALAGHVAWQVEEEVHHFASGQFAGLAVFLGIRYIDKVLIELVSGLGVRNGFDVAEVGFFSSIGYVVFPTFFLRSLGCRAMCLLELNPVI